MKKAILAELMTVVFVPGMSAAAPSGLASGQGGPLTFKRQDQV